MKARGVSIVMLFALMLLAAVAAAQQPSDVAPLKYWPAPLYWQPTQLESLNAAKPGARAEAQSGAQAPANSLVFVAITPCRIADTRTGFGFSGPFGPPSLVANNTRAFPIQESATCSIPSIARAYSFNLTVVTSSFLNYLTVWPLGATQPNASTLNDDLGTVVANAAIVPAGNDQYGSVNVFVSNNTDFIIDINGYYAAQSGITLAQGTVSAPSLSFTGDSGTGIYSSGAGTVNIAAGGKNAVSVLSTGDVDIPGSIRKNGTLFLHNLGTDNTAVGVAALNPASSGADNTASGFNALTANTSGFDNTAAGSGALFSNTMGSHNVAIGFEALNSNTTGTGNTANGDESLFGNTTGSYNTATGDSVLSMNTTGLNNTGDGSNALANNTTGSSNTGEGSNSLSNNTTGSNNTTVGYGAMYSNSTGNNNVAIGYQAGLSVNSGSSNNIFISSPGAPADSGAIRIGEEGTQTTFFAAGVYGATALAGIPMLVNANGQFGTMSSSRRYKEDIQNMADASSGLLRLRPVTFRYKQPYEDGSKPIDYGLIAEEVAEVYPDLVVKNADGQIETVQYQKLTPMLLNELQKQAAEIAEQKAEIAEMKELLAKLALSNSK